MTYKNTKEFALQLDANDELQHYRNEFHIPLQENGEEHIYLCGNSLGLQAKRTAAFINQELADWATFGVAGHFHAKNPWMSYHEFLTESYSKIVGAKQSEVVAMNTLTVNLHLMMVSFYRPTENRHKIIIEADSFPSDIYAVESQIKYHGYSVEESVIKLSPRDGESAIRTEDIEAIIEREGNEIALIMLGGVNYYTGQVFDFETITKLGQDKGIVVGFDLAHAAGNVKLEL
ncbi:MAG: aminotransferase class V-fold PLP-dependent enzyme, partial [Bacteroidota bacterium]|nr:aminotransferase class V-fold PLP-dependent enzyme [Bacteroidota bacterium]